MKQQKVQIGNTEYTKTIISRDNETMLKIANRILTYNFSTETEVYFFDVQPNIDEFAKFIQ